MGDYNLQHRLNGPGAFFFTKKIVPRIARKTAGKCCRSFRQWPICIPIYLYTSFGRFSINIVRSLRAPVIILRMLKR